MPLGVTFERALGEEAFSLPGGSGEEGGGGERKKKRSWRRRAASITGVDGQTEDCRVGPADPVKICQGSEQ